MKTINKLFRHFSLVTCLLLTHVMYGQTTVLSEGMGSVGGTTAISTHEAANGFDNDPQTMTGTADVRNTLPSSGYTGSSGAANIFVTNTSGRFFQIEGINTTGFSGLQLSFGMHKSTTASNGSDFVVEVSSDGVNYTALSYGPLPTGSGTAIWRRVTATGTIPSTSNLRVRFRQTATTTQYRVDDVLLTGTVSPSCTAEITADGPLTLCEGEDVVLTANSGASYLWSTGATTQSITVTTAGTYTVEVFDGMGCSAVSEPVNVVVNLAPFFAVTASSDTICPGDTVTLNARLFTDNLIISEYVEGTGLEKYIEIFNGTGATVNLSRYHYLAYHNGASTPTFDLPLTGTLADGDVLVLKNPSATGFLGTATSSSLIQHNGDDAVALFDSVDNVFVDIFGSIGNDPGTQWLLGGNSTVDHTLRRNNFVTFGITTNPNLPGASGFPTLGIEWNQSTVNDVSGLGSHALSCDYSWSPATIPATGCTVQAVPSGTQTFTVTATYNNGCTVTGTITITVLDSCDRGEERRSTVNNISTGVSVYPNPFSEATTISFHVPADNNPVLVDVIDINGKPVSNLYKGQMDAGDYRFNWNGNNVSGGRATAGIYICRIMIGNEMQTVRLLLQ